MFGSLALVRNLAVYPLVQTWQPQDPENQHGGNQNANTNASNCGVQNIMGCNSGYFHLLYTVYAANQLTETLYLVHVSVLATKLLLFQLFIKHCTLTYSTVQKF